MSFSEVISPLLGRFVLGWFFLSSALSYAGQWEATLLLMQMKGLPVPALLLALSLIVMILGSLSLLFGFHTRHGALMLFGFTVLASVLMHDYWKITEAAARAADYDIFARNIAIAGGLLVLVGMGPGPFGLDNSVGGKKKR